LPEGATGLLHVLKFTSSVSSIASFCTEPLKRLDLDTGLKLSLDECTEFTILCFMMIVVHGLLSFHHLKNRILPFTTPAAAAVTKNVHD